MRLCATMIIDFPLSSCLMNKKTPLILFASIVVSSLAFATVNSQQIPEEKPLSIENKTIRITTINALQTFFKGQGYTTKSWASDNFTIPRLTFSGVTNYWHKNSTRLNVQVKKDIFFRLMLPLILISNEKILAERAIVLKDPLDSNELKQIALKYRVIKKASLPLSESTRSQLLARVDTIPPSLALAQSAEESGWGASRFAREGNAFFGQWDFSGKGMKPARQRAHLGNYGVARFDSPLASVEGYMFNLNTVSAYSRLRVLRAKTRKRGRSATGVELAKTLNKYSERGAAYTKSLVGMINYNRLGKLDGAILSTGARTHIIFRD